MAVAGYYVWKWVKAADTSYDTTGSPSELDLALAREAALDVDTTSELIPIEKDVVTKKAKARYIKRVKAAKPKAKRAKRYGK